MGRESFSLDMVNKNMGKAMEKSWLLSMAVTLGNIDTSEDWADLSNDSAIDS